MHRQISTVLTDNVEEKNNTWFAEAGVNVETQIHSYNGNFQQKAETAQIHLKEWRFGFVNMKSNLMQTDLIQSLNGLWFDSYKLRENLQRFGRQRHEQKKDNLRPFQSSRCSPVPIGNRDSRNYATVWANEQFLLCGFVIKLQY